MNYVLIVAGLGYTGLALYTMYQLGYNRGLRAASKIGPVKGLPARMAPPLPRVKVPREQRAGVEPSRPW